MAISKKRHLRNQRAVAIPENSRELTKVSATILIAPGQEIAIKCEHGVTGIAKAVAVKH